MKQLILLATIISLVFSGSVTKVGDISGSYPTTGKLSGVSFYMSFTTPLKKGDIIRFVTPTDFKHPWTNFAYSVFDFPFSFDEASTTTLQTAAGSRGAGPISEVMKTSGTLQCMTGKGTGN